MSEVIAVSRSARHSVRKTPVPVVVLRAGLGVDDDAHAGITVQHRFDKRRDATRLNRRQVHLIGAELYDELNAGGFATGPGDLGENITVRGIELMPLPAGTQLCIGVDAVVELTGLRHPCDLIDRSLAGLRAATTTTFNGAKALRHGVMAVVIAGGEVRAGDPIRVALPPPPHVRLAPI